MGFFVEEPYGFTLAELDRLQCATDATTFGLMCLQLMI